MSHRAVQVLVLIVTFGVIAWWLWPDGGAEGQLVTDPWSVSPILKQLAPGATVHRVDVVYRRQGPVQAQVEDQHGYLPETVRSESWLTFDDHGALASFRGEIRRLDGTLVATSGVDEGDLVTWNAVGEETARIPGFSSRQTLERLIKKVATATLNTAGRLAESKASTVQLDGVELQVVESSRVIQAPEDSMQYEGYALPFTKDLAPVAEVRRVYVLPAEFRTTRSEVAVIGEDGTETIVESHEHQVFEVLDSD